MRNTKEWTEKDELFPNRFLLFKLLTRRRSQSKEAIPPTTPALMTPIMDKPTWPTAPPALLLPEDPEDLDIPVAAAPLTVRDGIPFPTHSSLYVARSLWMAAGSSEEGDKPTTQLMQVWIPLRFVNEQMQAAENVQPVTVRKTSAHWPWHAGGKMSMLD